MQTFYMRIRIYAIWKTRQISLLYAYTLLAFYAQRSQKRKKNTDDLLDCLFLPLGSALVKAASKTLVKSTY